MDKLYTESLAVPSNRVKELIAATPISAYTFQKEYISKLSAGDVARYYQLYPGPYPSDVKGGLFDEFFNNPPEAAANFTKLFREIFGTVTSRGIIVERLRVLPPVGFRNVEPRHLQAEIAMRQAAQDGGEVSRFVWYDDRLVDDLVAACGPDLALAHSYLEGVEQGVPRTSMWVTRATGGLTLQAARLIDYAQDDPSVIRSSSLYLTPTERDLQAFEGFWADLYHDKSRSYDLGQMVAIHRS